MKSHRLAVTGIHSAHHYHRGSALVISLVLLVILTLVATAGMTTSTLELRMAAGRQASLSAFEVAENAIETALACRHPAAGETLHAADCPAAATSGGAQYDFTVTRSAGSGPVPEGMSLGSELAAVQFTVDASATAGRGATAELQQGFYVMGLSE